MCNSFITLRAKYYHHSKAIFKGVGHQIYVSSLSLNMLRETPIRCFSFLKKKTGITSRNQKNLQPENGVFISFQSQQLEFHSRVTVSELIKHFSSIANQTIKEVCACVESVWVRVSLWECETIKVGTGQPSHPCSVLLHPRGKIERSGEVVNKILQWQTHKSRYEGLGQIPLQGGH